MKDLNVIRLNLLVEKFYTLTPDFFEDIPNVDLVDMSNIVLMNDTVYEIKFTCMTNLQVLVLEALIHSLKKLDLSNSLRTLLIKQLANSFSQKLVDHTERITGRHLPAESLSALMM